MPGEACPLSRVPLSLVHLYGPDDLLAMTVTSLDDSGVVLHIHRAGPDDLLQVIASVANSTHTAEWAFRPLHLVAMNVFDPAQPAYLACITSFLFELAYTVPPEDTFLLFFRMKKQQALRTQLLATMLRQHYLPLRYHGHQLPALAASPQGSQDFSQVIHAFVNLSMTSPSYRPKLVPDTSLIIWAKPTCPAQQHQWLVAPQVPELLDLQVVARTESQRRSLQMTLMPRIDVLQLHSRLSNAPLTFHKTLQSLQRKQQAFYRREALRRKLNAGKSIKSLLREKITVYESPDAVAAPGEGTSSIVRFEELAAVPTENEGDWTILRRRVQLKRRLYARVERDDTNEPRDEFYYNEC